MSAINFSSEYQCDFCGLTTKVEGVAKPIGWAELSYEKGGYHTCHVGGGCSNRRIVQHICEACLQKIEALRNKG